MSRKEWKAAAVLGIVLVALTILFNSIPINEQLAATILFAAAVVGAGLVANIESDPPIRSRSH